MVVFLSAENEIQVAVLKILALLLFFLYIYLNNMEY